MEENRYLNEKQVASMMGVAVQSLRNWRFLGEKLPYTKIGRAVRYSLQDVIEYMNKHRIDPGQ